MDNKKTAFYKSSLRQIINLINRFPERGKNTTTYKFHIKLQIQKFKNDRMVENMFQNQSNMVFAETC